MTNDGRRLFYLRPPSFVFCLSDSPPYSKAFMIAPVCVITIMKGCNGNGDGCIQRA
jgi:hypothetical protein